MKRLIVRSLALGLMASVSLFAHAQGPGPGGPGRGGGRGMMMMGRGGGGEGMALMLLANEKVQEELALEADQKEQLGKLRDEMMTPPGDFNFREASDEERQKFMEQMAERTRTAIKKMEEILIPPQLDRLHEIQIQQQGASSLMVGFVAEKLQLSADQKESLKKIAEEGQNKMREQMQGMFAGGFDEGSREKMREAMEKFRKEQDDSLLAVLTPDQKESFEKMKGEAFDLPREAMGFFGGRGRGGPGGPGGPGRGGPGGGGRGGDGDGEK
jgi:hypothetical protein